MPAASTEDRPVAPGGWGWPPGYPLFLPTAADLPELPLLMQLNPRTRVPVLTEALRLVPNHEKIRPRDVIARYGIPSTTASSVIARLRDYY